MSERERSVEDLCERKTQVPVSGEPTAAGLAGLREAGETFLSAGDEAISRALSADSGKFLEANRQQGGE